jgi:hypothetical protein
MEPNSWQRTESWGLSLTSAFTSPDAFSWPGDFVRISDKEWHPSPSTSLASTTMTPAFAEYRQTLDGAALMPSHAKARRRCSCRSVPRVLPGRQIQRAPRLRGTIFARVEEWYRLPTTYHDGPACTPTPRQCSHHARRGVGAAGAGDPADHHPGAGLAMNENPLQGSFAVDEPTDQLGGMDTSGITRSER